MFQYSRIKLTHNFSENGELYHVKGNVNQHGFENLAVFKHQTLWWPLWFMVDGYPVCLATPLTCLFKVGRKEGVCEINQ